MIKYVFVYLALATSALAVVKPAPAPPVSTVSMRVEGVNVAATNNRDIVAVFLMQTSLRARTLKRGTEGSVQETTDGLRYTERRTTGELVLTLAQDGDDTSATLAYSDSLDTDPKRSAELVLQALVTKVVKGALDQPQPEVDRWLTMYEQSDRPANTGDFSIALMRITGKPAVGATMNEVEKALGPPSSKSDGQVHYGTQRLTFEGSILVRVE